VLKRVLVGVAAAAILLVAPGLAGTASASTVQPNDCNSGKQAVPYPTQQVVVPDVGCPGQS
jgi:hypothetical protein